METTSLDRYRGVPLGVEAFVNPTLAALLAEAMRQPPVRLPEQRIES